MKALRTTVLLAIIGLTFPNRAVAVFTGNFNGYTAVSRR
jgi:hypothetical protein